MIRSRTILVRRFIQSCVNPIPSSHLSTSIITNDLTTTTTTANPSKPVAVEVSKFTSSKDHDDLLHPKHEIKAACGDIKTHNDGNDDDDEMEQEDMFVDAHDSFEHGKKEWGGPRRGGRLPEPTRFGDWERNGRCSDF